MDKGKSLDKKSYEDKCKHSSEREQLATEAERASIKYKMVEFMKDKIGNEYNGNVSGITDWGMFVELEETKVEGLVALRDIKEDYFVFDEETLTLTGKSTGQKYTFGTPVRVKVVKANLEQKQLDFSLIWDQNFVSKEPKNSSSRRSSRDSDKPRSRKSGGKSHSTTSWNQSKGGKEVSKGKGKTGDKRKRS